MNLLSISQRISTSKTPPVIDSTLRIQRSVNGAAVPVVYGTARISGNLIWYGDFQANPAPSQGGKGGGKGGAGGASTKGQPGKYTYQASFALGLAAGPIQGIARIWQSSGTADTPPSLGGALAIQLGAAGQSPWSYLASLHPDQALGYSGLAYLAVAAMPLGQSAELPNLSLEVIGLGPASSVTAWSPPPNGAAWSPEFTQPSYPSAPFAAIAAVTKAPSSGANAVFDTSPAFCIADLLTNASYGAGLDASLIGDLTAYATWCQAAGLAISAALTESRALRDILRDWLDATLADIYWSQGQIKIAPLADQAVTGTASDGSSLTYTPTLAPVMAIDDSLMIVTSQDAGPLAVTRKDPAEAINRVTVEYASRDNDYNSLTVTADDMAHIAAYGLRPAPSLRADFVTQGGAAQTIAALRLGREMGVLATYEWRMRSPGELLEPFDVVTITDTALGLANYPVRVTEVEEEDDSVFRIAAEDIPGLIGAMAARPLAQNAGFRAATNAYPGNVNAPVIFEPPSALVTSGTGLEIWIAASGANTDSWGGCQVWVSSDGNSYTDAGTIAGPARQGLLTAPLAAAAAAANPPTIDAASTLAVDLSQSDGALSAVSQADALALNSLCFVDGELLSYRDAALTGASAYALNWLVRGAYDSPIGAHTAGAAFARLDGAIFRYPFTADRIGATVYLKFASFNQRGGGQQTLDQVEAYAYTIQGTALAEDPANVTGLASAYVAGLAQLTWNPVADARAIDYEIRLGGTWNGALVIGRTPLAQAPILGDGTYWLAAHYKVPNGADVYSPAPASLTVTGSALTSNVIASHSQAAEGWPGAAVNCGASNGALTLAGTGDILAVADIAALGDVVFYGGVAAAGSYQIPAADRVDIGRVAACNVMITLGALMGYALNALDITQVADITQTSDVLGVDLGDKVWAVPQIRTSQDGATWGAWQNWIPGSYAARAFDARVLLYSADASVAAVLSDFVFAVDVPDRVDTGTSVAVAAGGLAVVFAAPFNGGPGAAALPNLQITIHGASQGDQIVTSARSLAGFAVQITNGGAGVARTIDWQAQGY